MRHSDPTALFDHEVETEADVTQEFWGASAGWQSHDDRTPRRLPRVDDTGSLAAIRNGVAAFRPRRVELRDPSGEVRRTRSHGGQPPAAPTMSEQRAQSSIGDLAAGRYDEVHTEPERDGDVALTPADSITERIGLGGADPLLVRLGVLLLVGVLLVPIALALRPSSDEPDTVQIETPTDPTPAAVGDAPVLAGSDAAPSAAESNAAAAAAEPTDPTTTQDEAPTSGANESADAPVAAVAATAAASEPASASSTESVSGEDPVGDTPQSVDGGIDEPATVDATAERVVPECPQTYDAATGDSWYRMADAAGITPNALLNENRATLDTVILPGDEICLPSGATVPDPPPAPAPAPTPPPTTTATTTATTTTVASTTPSGSPGRNASVDEVKALIRSVFPESEWETGFRIAERESRFIPTAYNGWCCYGVFQIYWSVHQSWLDDVGVYSSDDLFDPLLNVRAAFQLWQRAGNSWTPWSTY